jgi:hypothetical protein
VRVEVKTLRAVIEAARRWRDVEDKNLGNIFAQPHTRDLMTAVDALLAEEMRAEPNRPHGFVLTRKWCEVPAGWFVQAPNGAWFEVTSSVEEDSETQRVGLLINGKRGEYPRVRDAEVKVRKGSKYLAEATALEALRTSFGVAEILDSPPWEE